MSRLRTFGRVMLGALYAAIPIVGWVALARSFKRVNPGEIALVNNVNGTYQLLEEGMHFRPFPGDRFTQNFNKSDDYIDMGPVKRVRIKEGQQGVKNDNGVYKILQPGIHIIDGTKNQTFNRDTDIQNINSPDYTLGATRYVTIENGYLGESYLNGQFTVLEAGKKHELPPNHRFVKKVSVASDVVDLGAMKIVTVKEGQRAIVNGANGNEVYGPGKHYIKQDEGNFFSEIITISPQVLSLAPCEVMCSDKIDMMVEAALIYEIVEPLKIVGAGRTNVLESLKKIADSTLREIMRMFDSKDIALGLHPDENHASHQRNKKLAEIHDQFVKVLDQKASKWGVKISDLQFTHILPADKEFQEMLRRLGVQLSTAETNKVLEEANGVVNKIRAQAEESRVIAAEIEQREAIVRAETNLKTKEIEAQAAYKQSMQKSKAEADGISLKAHAEAARVELMGKAEAERVHKLAEAYDTLKSEVAQNAMLMDKQGEIIKQVSDPVFVQPQLGNTSVWSNKNNRLTHFTNQPKNSGSNLIEGLDLDTNLRVRKLGNTLPQPEPERTGLRK